MASAGQHVAVSVLVPIRNEGTHIRATLKAMRAQDFDGTVEFLLLDGGSTDSTLAKLAGVAEADPRVRLHQIPGSSIPRLLNLGLRMARGDLIARMDAHTLFPPDYLANGVARLSRGDVGSVSGPQIAFGNGTWSRRVALALRSVLGRGGARFRHLSAGEIEVDSGFCGIWRRSLLVSHGGWNEAVLKAEDIELAARIRQAGERIVCVPTMAARYLPRETLRGLASQYWRYGYYRLRIVRSHPETFRRSHILPPAVVLTIAAAAVAPRRVALLARRGVALYATALAIESARTGRDEPSRDALGLPVVFATMHFAWGSGFLAGCLRHGPPWAALRHQFGSGHPLARAARADRRPAASRTR